ncbi:DUF4381 domain-containing protein [Leucothrix sargassi]|nr:DUF4381 domain-containing protein [Leucothrix sargassi]
MNPLGQLKDIHLPSEVNWWPLAIGWWLVAAALVLLVILLVVSLRKRRLKKSQFATVMTPFDALASNQTLSSNEWLDELSMLLRRVAMNQQGRENVAGLVGKDWLSYLDKSANTTEFTQGVGQALADQPYQATAVYDRDALIALARRWISAQAKRGSHA